MAFAESFRSFLGVLFRRDLVRGFLLPFRFCFRSVCDTCVCFVIDEQEKEKEVRMVQSIKQTN